MTAGGARRRAPAPVRVGPQVLAALLLAGVLGAGTALRTTGGAGSGFPPAGAQAVRAAADAQPRPPVVRPGPKPAPAGRLDLNAADARALAALPGIGPELAERIVAERAARGPFVSPEDLRRVPGMGPGRLERIRPFVRAASQP